GEEGYLQEKVRQQGGQVLCLPFLRWAHRFQRPRGAPYSVRTWDKCRNALIGHIELGLDLSAVLDHFATLMPFEVLEQVVSSVQHDLQVDEIPNLSSLLSQIRAHQREMLTTETSAGADQKVDEPPPRG
ncbi:MAG TPA: hypothetical protein VEW66_02125, partial [Thermomicrobiales bacterium]|nr:hypothetical protein [Thermomicrobiales bacterium]